MKGKRRDEDIDMEGRERGEEQCERKGDSDRV